MIVNNAPRMDRAHIADALTLSRMVLAPWIGWCVAAGYVGLAVALLGCAWLTDYWDGRFARAASQPTCLHRWDVRTDAWLGSCLVVGLASGGYLPWEVATAIVALAVIGALVVTNPALLALCTGTMFAIAVWELTVHGGRLRWVPATYVIIATVAARHRVFGVNIPGVFRALRNPRAARGVVLDDWCGRTDGTQ